MNIGVILAIGESLSDLKSKGQLKRLIDYNIKKYCQAFDRVFIFSYGNEKNFKLPKNCQLVANTSGMHRYPYSILMPILNYGEVAKCDVLRGLQLSGGIPAAVSKFIYGKRFVINYGYDYSKFAKIEGKPAQSLLYKIVTMPIISLAQAVIVTSREIKKNLEGSVRKSKIHFIPNGVDTRLFKRINIRRKPGFTVLYIGRLEKQKNLENLVKALSNIKGVKAFFYGNGSLKGNLKTQAKKLKVDLKIMDPIEYREIPRVMSTADVFVLPSLVEGSPKILLEAMACQKAIVGTNVKGISEIIDKGYDGLLTNSDPESIAKAIIKLESEDLREKLGKQAREHVIKNYEIQRLLKLEIKLLKEVASER